MLKKELLANIKFKAANSKALVFYHKDLVLVPKTIKTLRLKRLFDRKLFLPVFRKKTSFNIKALKGTLMGSLINKIKGFNRLFYEVLTLKGVGYSATVENNTLHINAGFSHSIKIEILSKLNVLCIKKTQIIVSGIYLDTVKAFCALIKKKVPFNAYKQKGLFFRSEKVKKKAIRK